MGIVLVACQQSEKKSTEEWIQLFNGRDLDDWTPKLFGV